MKATRDEERDRQKPPPPIKAETRNFSLSNHSDEILSNAEKVWMTLAQNSPDKVIHLCTYYPASDYNVAVLSIGSCGIVVGVQFRNAFLCFTTPYW